MRATNTMNASPLPTLPPELLFMIIKRCDRETQVSWSATNQSNRVFTESLLWKSLELSYNDMDALDRFNDMINPQSSDISVVRDSLDAYHLQPSQWAPIGGILQALTKHSSTAKPTWPSGVHVKKFTVRLMKLDNLPELVPQRSINNAMSLLLPQMPNLESCCFEGLFYTLTLREVVRARNLHTLELRTDNDYLSLDHSDRVATSEVRLGIVDYFDKAPHIGFRAMIVDFTLLSRLPFLRKLVVRRFVEGEATSLARGLGSLSALEHLEIEVPHWSYRWGHATEGTGSFFIPDGPSPLPHLIQTLANDGTKHFPSTLKVLILRATTEAGVGSVMCRASLSQVIRPCRQLHTLEIDLCSIPDSIACQDAVLAAALPALETLSFPFLDEIHEEARRTTGRVVIQDPQG